MAIEIRQIMITIAAILVTVFGIFLAYQILLHILGGSWAVEDLILAFLIFDIGITITVGYQLATLKSDHKHLSDKFNHMANDFKTHLRRKK